MPQIFRKEKKNRASINSIKKLLLVSQQNVSFLYFYYNIKTVPFPFIRPIINLKHTFGEREREFCVCIGGGFRCCLFFNLSVIKGKVFETQQEIKR